MSFPLSPGVCKRPVVTLNYQQLHSISHPVAIAVFASSEAVSAAATTVINPKKEL